MIKVKRVIIRGDDGTIEHSYFGERFSVGEVVEGYFLTDSELKRVAQEAWNAGFKHRDSDELAPPDFADYWQQARKGAK